MRLGIAIGLVGLLLFVSGTLRTDARQGDKALDGTWKLTKGEAGGKALTADELKGGKLVLKRNKYTVTLAGRGTVTGTSKRDPSKNPSTIDIKDATGVNKGKTCLGIYQLKGDVFQVAFAPPGKPRPTNFSTAPDSGEWMHFWTRVK